MHALPGHLAEVGAHALRCRLTRACMQACLVRPLRCGAVRCDGCRPLTSAPLALPRVRRLVQVCHGAPGLLLLLLAEHVRAFGRPDAAMLASMRAAAAAVWERVLLTKARC